MSDGSAVHRRRRAAAALAASAACAVAIAIGLAVWPSEGSPLVRDESSSLAGPAQSALDVPAPELLPDDPNGSLWSVVRRPVTARAAPDAGARAVASLEVTT